MNDMNDPRTIIVGVFTNKRFINRLIEHFRLHVREIDPAAKREKNEARQVEMQERGLEEVRPGIGDTGKPVFEGEDGARQDVEMTTFFRGLKDKGYKLVDVFAEREGWVRRVRIVFERTPADGMSRTRVSFDQLISFFEGNVFGEVHIWSNPNDVDTINLKGGMKTTETNDYRSLIFAPGARHERQRYQARRPPRAQSEAAPS